MFGVCEKEGGGGGVKALVAQLRKQNLFAASLTQQGLNKFKILSTNNEIESLPGSSVRG